MRKQLIIALTLVLSFTLISCKSNSDSKDNNNKPEVQENNTSNDSKNDDENTDTDKKENENTTEPNNSNETLSLYKVDENSLEPNKDDDVSIQADASLETKLQELSIAVSKDYFNGLPIKVKSIDEVSGKKIATINLADGDDGSTWVEHFQGSTGGQITTNTLIENFLQVNYKGEWIDGVTFLYNDAPIEYDHVYKLSQTQYRN